MRAPANHLKSAAANRAAAILIFLTILRVLFLDVSSAAAGKPHAEEQTEAMAALPQQPPGGRQAIDPPAAELPPGWEKSGAMRSYERQNLYGYINGGAELFLEYGFCQLKSQHYQSDQMEVVLDLYEMDSADGALAIYLTKKGVETPVADLPCRHSGSSWQITALYGRYFIQITNLGGQERALPLMVQLLQLILPQIIPEQPKPWLEGLPADRIPGSELLLAGPWSMQMVYSLGEGDILQLGGRVMGISVERPGPGQTRQAWMRIIYPDSLAARTAFLSLGNNLDPYLNPLRSTADTLIFRDYQQEFGRVTRRHEIIEIALHLVNTAQ